MSEIISLAQRKRNTKWNNEICLWNERYTNMLLTKEVKFTELDKARLDARFSLGGRRKGGLYHLGLHEIVKKIPRAPSPIHQCKD